MLIWEIIGCKHGKVIFKDVIPCNDTTQKDIKSLLKTLVAKHSSIPDTEIARSFINKRSPRFSKALEVKRLSMSPKEFSCGEDPVFTATTRMAKAKSSF